MPHNANLILCFMHIFLLAGTEKKNLYYSECLIFMKNKIDFHCYSPIFSSFIYAFFCYYLK